MSIIDDELPPLERVEEFYTTQQQQQQAEPTIQKHPNDNSHPKSRTSDSIDSASDSSSSLIDLVPTRVSWIGRLNRTVTNESANSSSNVSFKLRGVQIAGPLVFECPLPAVLEERHRIRLESIEEYISELVASGSKKILTFAFECLQESANHNNHNNHHDYTQFNEFYRSQHRALVFDYQSIPSISQRFLLYIIPLDSDIDTNTAASASEEKKYFSPSYCMEKLKFHKPKGKLLGFCIVEKEFNQLVRERIIQEVKQSQQQLMNNSNRNQLENNSFSVHQKSHSRSAPSDPRSTVSSASSVLASELIRNPEKLDAIERYVEGLVNIGQESASRITPLPTQRNQFQQYSSPPLNAQLPPVHSQSQYYSAPPPIDNYSQPQPQHPQPFPPQIAVHQTVYNPVPTQMSQMPPMQLPYLSAPASSTHFHSGSLQTPPVDSHSHQQFHPSPHQVPSQPIPYSSHPNQNPIYHEPSFPSTAAPLIYSQPIPQNHPQYSNPPVYDPQTQFQSQSQPQQLSMPQYSNLQPAQVQSIPQFHPPHMPIPPTQPIQLIQYSQFPPSQPQPANSNTLFPPQAHLQPNFNPQFNQQNFPPPNQQEFTNQYQPQHQPSSHAASISSPVLPPDLSSFPNIENLLHLPEFNFLSQEAKSEVIRIANKQKSNQQTNSSHQSRNERIQPAAAAESQSSSNKRRSMLPPLKKFVQYREPPKKRNHIQRADELEEGEIRHY